MWAGTRSGGFQVTEFSTVNSFLAKAVLDILVIQKVRKSGDAAQ